MSEKWSERWAEEETTYKELERALKKLGKLKGEKRRLMIKAVCHYIEAMIGEEHNR